MYKQITAGNFYDLVQKMHGTRNCNIFIKPTVDRQIEFMMVHTPADYNLFVSDLNERNITLILEEKGRKLRKVILEPIPIPEKKDGE